MTTAVRDHPRATVRPSRRARLAALQVLMRDRAALTGAVIVLVYVTAALAGPLVVSVMPNEMDATARFAPPSLAQPLGTDHLGRDVLARLVHGGRTSLGLALAATAGTTLLGLLFGMVAAVWGGVVDGLIMRVVDILQALPGLLLALAVLGLLGPSLRNLVITIIAVGWANYARVVRSIALSVKERPFVEAAHALGAGQSRILFRHVLPHVLGPTIVLSTLSMGAMLLIVSGLSFLGLGAPPSVPEWGAMLSEARTYYDRAPRLLVYPGVAITGFVLAFNLLGDGLRDLFDPRIRQQHMVR